MNQIETLKEKIEMERQKLNRLAGGTDVEETYRQSRVVDKLIEEYIELTSA